MELCCIICGERKHLSLFHNQIVTFGAIVSVTSLSLYIWEVSHTVLGMAIAVLGLLYVICIVEYARTYYDEKARK